MISEVNGPFVSVVTPVYNGERYLAECIESVRSQTYRNWEYVVVNNCSTDRTRDIAHRYAAQDERIRVYDNEQLVGVIQNHNIAFERISSKSKYCKVLQADDFLFPRCLAEMVTVAEENPTVGLVGSYCLWGSEVKCDGLPYPSTVVSGRELCRMTLSEQIYVFLSPSCLMVRADLIRGRVAFYNETHLHADVEACFEVLRDADFGFVHEVLTFVRTHDESLTSRDAAPLNSYAPAWLDMMTRYGPVYFTDGEFRDLLARRVREYYRFLGKSVLRLEGKRFWDYHRTALQNLGYSLSFVQLTKGSLSVVADVFLHPVNVFLRTVEMLRHRRG